MSFVFTGFFKKNMFLNFLWRQGLRWSLAGLEIIILLAAASFKTLASREMGWYHFSKSQQENGQKNIENNPKNTAG